MYYILYELSTKRLPHDCLQIRHACTQYKYNKYSDTPYLSIGSALFSRHAPYTRVPSSLPRSFPCRNCPLQLFISLVNIMHTFRNTILKPAKEAGRTRSRNANYHDPNLPLLILASSSTFALESKSSEYLVSSSPPCRNRWIYYYKTHLLSCDRRAKKRNIPTKSSIPITAATMLILALAPVLRSEFNLMQISRDGQIVDEACGRVVTIDELAVVEDDIETKDNSLEEEEAVWAVVVSGGLKMSTAIPVKVLKRSRYRLGSSSPIVLNHNNKPI